MCLDDEVSSIGQDRWRWNDACSKSI